MTAGAPAEVPLPHLGEQIDEATVVHWLKSVGDVVGEGDALFEVSTDKVDSEVPSPVSGILLEQLADEGETVAVGAIVARIGSSEQTGATAPTGGAGEDRTSSPGEPEPEGAPVAPPPPSPPSPPSPTPEAVAAVAPSPPSPTPEAVVSVAAVGATPVGATPASADPAAPDDRLISPVVGRMAADHQLDLATVVGTGHGHRITRFDAEAAIAAAPTTRAIPAAMPDTPIAATETRRDDKREVVPLNRIRARTADHMVRSVSTAPHALTAVEVDFEGIDRVRRARQAAWKQEEGFSLTYLPFILVALGTALRDYPLVNGSFVGDGVALNPSRNVAVAVDLDFDGLVAPIVRSVDDKRFRAVAREIVDVAARARARALRPDDVSGGTFTVTNAGRYRTLMQFPIINQPQVAILSTDGVTRKPVVIVDGDGAEGIAIHSVGVLALAWDHRAIDGAYAAAFLDRLRELLQDTDWQAQLGGSRSVL